MSEGLIASRTETKQPRTAATQAHWLSCQTLARMCLGMCPRSPKLHRLPILPLHATVQVAKVKERLQGVSLAISTIRVARVFVGDFAAVQQELQSTQKLLAAIQQSPCRHGVLSHLQAEVKQQEKMLAAAQVGSQAAKL